MSRMVQRDLDDALRRDDIERARHTSMEERVRQAREVMEVGIRLQRAAIRARFPHATEEDAERRLRLWLARDERWRLADG